MRVRSSCIPAMNFMSRSSHQVTTYFTRNAKYKVTEFHKLMALTLAAFCQRSIFIHPFSVLGKVAFQALPLRNRIGPQRLRYRLQKIKIREAVCLSVLQRPGVGTKT
jgi:hypothetical protein